MINLIAALVISAHAAGPQHVAGPQIVNVKVDESGFTPAEIKAPVGSTVELHLTRTTDDTCATSIVVPSLKISKKLPLNKEVVVSLSNLKKGTLKFGCQMNMMLSGAVVVE